LPLSQILTLGTSDFPHSSRWFLYIAHFLEPTMAQQPTERLEHVLQLTPLATAAASASPAAAPSTAAVAAAATTGTSSPAAAVTLEAHLASLAHVTGPDQSLSHLLLSLAGACASIARVLRSSAVVSAVGSSNSFGDAQLNVDLSSQACVMDALRASGVVALASSEEEPVRIDLSDSLRPEVGREKVFSVSFDPLDGSSIIDANFAVGSIFSVFPGRELLGRRVDEQVAAAVAMYGPRTSIVFALPGGHVFEVALVEAAAAGSSADNGSSSSLSGLSGDRWVLTRPSLRLARSTKYFAPANLRATSEDPLYRQLVVDHYLARKYTLRYSGGLVPDFYHALIKGSGVFLSPVTERSPAKLRLLYEVAALAFLSTQAGGGAVDQHGAELMGRTLEHYDQRSGLVIGSMDEVERYSQLQRGSKQV
jgi:sedoheptulose-bisphosphatase